MSVSCKIMESIIWDAITEHLLNCNLIKKSQHGFLKDRSCVTNLLEFLEKATSVVGFDVVYLDFDKAFDQCYGSGSGIRCLFDPWIWDP
jgi:hypothetical protein